MHIPNFSFVSFLWNIIRVAISSCTSYTSHTLAYSSYVRSKLASEWFPQSIPHSFPVTPHYRVGMCRCRHQSSVLSTPCCNRGKKGPKRKNVKYFPSSWRTRSGKLNWFDARPNNISTNHISLMNVIIHGIFYFRCSDFLFLSFSSLFSSRSNFSQRMTCNNLYTNSTIHST